MKKYQALMIPLGVVLLSFAGGLQAKKILLWNTLDSEQAVLNSEIGPDGTIVGTAFAFESGQFGNGYIRKDLGDNWVEFPQSIPEQLHGEGTVEMVQGLFMGVHGRVSGGLLASGGVRQAPGPRARPR